MRPYVHTLTMQLIFMRLNALIGVFRCKSCGRIAFKMRPIRNISVLILKLASRSCLCSSYFVDL